jgi:uncharacterized protein (TIGR03437 family)
MLFDFDRDGKTDVVYGNGNAGFLSATQSAPVLSVLPGAVVQKPELSIVSAASFSAGALAPESLASVFGQDIAAMATSASTPLPTSLSGITVVDATGTSRPASLLFVSPGQVNFIVPADTAIGLASITVRGTLSRKALTAHVQIAEVAPVLFSVGQQIAAAIVVQVTPGGAQTILPAYTVQAGNVTPVPIDVSQPGQTFLELFGTGVRRGTMGPVAVNVHGASVPVAYAGPQGTYPGLDQVNVLLPPELAGSGTARVALLIAGSRSNAVLVMIR